MKEEIVKGMISNSTWIDPENKVVFKFTDDKKLTINGDTQLPYSVLTKQNKIVLKLGTTQMYHVEYVNDFQLKIYNEHEKFRIIPA